MTISPLLIYAAIGIALFWIIPRRGLSPFLGLGLVIISFVLPILVLPFVLVLMFIKKPLFKQPRATQTLPQSTLCPKCGTENPPKNTHCKTCNNTLSISESNT